MLTVEEYLKIPDPKGCRTELHHGEVVAKPLPKVGHQRIQSRIETLLSRLLADSGVTYSQMPFQPVREYEVWVADVGYVTSERHRVTGDDEYLQGAPDLVVDVLSPDDTMMELNDKMALCLNNGCTSFWVVDPKRSTVFVTESSVTRHYGLTDTIPCSLLSGEIPVREIFV